MVKKLFKHEFLSYIRIMSVVCIILLCVAVAGRVIQCFESDRLSYELISGLSFATYTVSAFAALLFAFALAIVRFYKNLFTCEGYLTFTLPVTASQHIIVKAVTAVCIMLLTVVAVVASFCIMTAGAAFSEMWREMTGTLAQIYGQMGFHTVIFGVEFIVLVVLWLLWGILLYDTFISIGQLFKKNRILAAVGAYFVYYILTQILSSIFLVLFAVLASADGFRDFVLQLTEFTMLHPCASIHIGAGIFAVMISAFILLEFVVIKKIITQKLNLE